jgi:hypothetical protein
LAERVDLENNFALQPGRGKEHSGLEEKEWRKNRGEEQVRGWKRRGAGEGVEEERSR